MLFQRLLLRLIPAFLEKYMSPFMQFNPSNNACTNLYDYPIKIISKNCYYNFNVHSRTPQVIEQSGYELETYTVTTPDGYILTLFRIPPNATDYRKNKQPVFLQHGLAVDSANWVHIGNRSLAFNLADEGYDVWLGNQRGTRYSRNHTTLRDSDFKYWLYNLDDLAVNDTRTVLNEIARITRKPSSIIYIGHSRGTTLGFMFASEFPEEAEQLLRGIVAVSPIVYLNFSELTKPAVIIFPFIYRLLHRLQKPAFFYNTDSITQFFRYFCTVFPYVCMLTLTTKFGATSQFLADDLLLVFENFPSTVSVLEIYHYCQLYNSGKFQKFDYGKKENRRRYGQSKPPVYNLENIRIPVFLYYGKSDSLISEENVEKLLNELGSDRKVAQTVPLHVTDENYQFNHVGFTYSKYLKQFFYKDLLDILEKELFYNTTNVRKIFTSV